MVSRPVTSSSISRSVSLISVLVACGGRHEPQPAPAAPAASSAAPAAPAAPTAATPGAAAPTGPPGAAAPDVVMVGGDLWTMDPQHPRASAVAWRGDQIVAVGDDAQVRAL